MPTKDIFKNIEIKDKSKAETFIEALEKSERKAKEFEVFAVLGKTPVIKGKAAKKILDSYKYS